MEFRPGDVVLLAFPFTDTGAVKRRPALVLADTGDADLVLARVTSQPAVGSYDVQLRDWQEANLLLPSIARVHKIATLAKSMVERKLGRLSPADWTATAEALHRLLVSD